MFKYKTIHNSQFSNYDGGLNLILGDDGNRYLVMDDFYGPLTDEQVAAFYIICGVNKYDVDPVVDGENSRYTINSIRMARE